MKKLLPLNWSLVFLHFLAYWFIANACSTLSYLIYTDVIELVRAGSDETASAIQQFIQYDSTGSTVSYFLLIPQLASLAGVILMLILSIRQSVKHRWPLGSALLTFILVLLFTRWGPNTTALRFQFWQLGNLIPQIWFEYLVNGLSLLAIGLLLLYSKASIRFIEAAQQRPAPAPTELPAS